MIRVVAGICIKYIENTPYVLMGLKPDGHWEFPVLFYEVELTKADNDGSGATAKEHIDVTWFDISNLDSIPMADTNHIIANLLIQNYL